MKQSKPGLGKVGHIDTSCKIQANSDSGSCPKQTGVNKNKSTKANVSLKRKSASNSECSDIESKTLIIQLERQIRKKIRQSNY